eukprot:15025907-Alexandrium_andersonii.AAC.1
MRCPRVRRSQRTTSRRSITRSAARSSCATRPSRFGSGPPRGSAPGARISGRRGCCWPRRP